MIGPTGTLLALPLRMLLLGGIATVLVFSVAWSALMQRVMRLPNDGQKVSS